MSLKVWAWKTCIRITGKFRKNEDSPEPTQTLCIRSCGLMPRCQHFKQSLVDSSEHSHIKCIYSEHCVYASAGVHTSVRHSSCSQATVWRVTNEYTRLIQTRLCREGARTLVVNKRWCLAWRGGGWYNGVVFAVHKKKKKSKFVNDF